MRDGLTEQRVGAVVVAAGGSVRMAGVDKTFVKVLGQPLIVYTLDQLEAFPAIAEIVLVLAAQSVATGRDIVRRRGYRKVSRVCAGGVRRQESVRVGLAALQPCRWVMVHDGARPGLDAALLQRGLATVTGRQCPAATAGIPVKDTIKVVSPEGQVTATLRRETLWAAQTPQIFAYDRLRQAHAEYQGDATDDAMMLESLGCPVQVFPGSYDNLKVTTPEDLAAIEAVLRRRQ